MRNNKKGLTINIVNEEFVCECEWFESGNVTSSKRGDNKSSKKKALNFHFYKPLFSCYVAFNPSASYPSREA